jgi:GNAT superfamily N-acetyltransferase
VIRRALLSDSDQISSISRTAGYMDYISENVLDFIGNNDVFLYEDEGKILGFTSLNRSGTFRFYMGGMRVRNEYRRLGIATQLMKFCENVAVENGAKFIGCLVEENNLKSRNLVEKMNYRNMGKFVSIGGMPLIGNEVHEYSPKSDFYYIRDWEVIHSSDSTGYLVQSDNDGNIMCLSGEWITFIKTINLPEYRASNDFFFVNDSSLNPPPESMIFINFQKNIS